MKEISYLHFRGKILSKKTLLSYLVTPRLPINEKEHHLLHLHHHLHQSHQDQKCGGFQKQSLEIKEFEDDTIKNRNIIMIR